MRVRALSVISAIPGARDYRWQQFVASFFLLSWMVRHTLRLAQEESSFSSVLLTIFSKRSPLACHRSFHSGVTYSAPSIMFALSIISLAVGLGSGQFVGDGIVKTLTTVPQCATPLVVVLNPASGEVYAACGTSGVISITATAVRTLIPISNSVASIQTVMFDPASGVFYAGCTPWNIYQSSLLAVNRSKTTSLVAATTCISVSQILLTVGILSNATMGLYVVCNLYGNTGASISKIEGKIEGVVVQNIVSCGSGIGNMFMNDTSGAIFVGCWYSGSRGFSSYSDLITIRETNVSRYRMAPTQCYAPYALAGVTETTLLMGCQVAVNGSSVVSFNGTTVSPVLSSQLCPYPVTFATNPVSKIIYIGCGDGTLISFNNSQLTTLVSRAETATQCSQPGLKSISVNPISGFIYAACADRVVSINVLRYCVSGAFWNITNRACTVTGVGAPATVGMTRCSFPEANNRGLASPDTNV
jgi:hypothetical protein